MSIIVRLKDTGEVLEVSPDFKLEVQNTSPVFNDLGSKTVTTSLPNTPQNSRLLGFSHRLDLRDKPIDKMEVIVSAGSYTRDGMLYIVSTDSPETSYGVIIAFNEGIMYETMSDLMLDELPNLPIIRKPVPELIADMNQLLQVDDTNTDLTVFTAVLKDQSYTIDDHELFFNESINQVVYANASLMEHETTYIVEDGKLLSTDVPQGYGISPFIRVWKVLDLIFDYFGYRIGENPFKEDFQLKRLCLLNNSVDSIVGGELRYSDLLPHVSVMDFLHSLYGRFGLKIFVDSSSKTVNLKLLKNILSTNQGELISFSSVPYVLPPTPKQLKLSGAKNLDKSDTDTETLEDFLEKYNNTVGTYPYYTNYVEVGGVYYDERTGTYYQISTTYQEQKRLSSCHFDWNKKEKNLETEEIIVNDECLSLKRGNDVYLYIGMDGTYNNIVLTVNGHSVNTDNGTLFAFAYDMGEAYSGSGDDKKYFGYKFGSIFPYKRNGVGELQEDRDGNVFKYALTFTGEHGAFHQFFKEYDAFLRHSNRVVKFDHHAPSFEVANVDFSKKRMIQNQPILLDKVDHLLDGNPSQTIQIEARTLRLYAPYNLETEQHLPVPDPIKYKWVLGSNQQSKISNIRDEILATIPEDVPNSYMTLSFTDGKILEDPSDPTKTTYWFLPPTDSQYQNKTNVGFQSHTCKVEYVHTYQINRGSATQPNWDTYKDEYIRDVVYQSSFEPDLI